MPRAAYVTIEPRLHAAGCRRWRKGQRETALGFDIDNCERCRNLYTRIQRYGGRLVRATATLYPQARL